MEIQTRLENGVYSVTMQGKFIFTDNQQFRPILEKLGDPAILQVVLLMEKVDFVDSAALGMLLLAHDEAVKYQKTLSLRGVNGQVKRIFEMARFEQFFNF